MIKHPPLHPGLYYHIFSRGNNRENMFIEARNYPYFLKLYAYHVEPIADTFAFCLMRNHFHLLVRIKEIENLISVSDRDYASQKFGSFLNAYAKAINKAYNRTSSLFEHPFSRIVVDSDAYFTCLVAYIHRNAQKHGFVDDFREWPYSSYPACLSEKPTQIKRPEVLEWFGGVAGFEEFHQQTETEAKIKYLIEAD